GRRRRRHALCRIQGAFGERSRRRGGRGFVSPGRRQEQDLRAGPRRAWRRALYRGAFEEGREREDQREGLRNHPNRLREEKVMSNYEQLVIARDFSIRRSELTCPAHSLKMMTKAAGSEADEVILDLEDSCAVSQKVDRKS